MKKIMMSCLMLAIVLAGCSSGDVDTDDTSTGGEGDITIGMWESSDAEKEAVNKVATQFTEKTGFNVDVRVYSDYTQQLSTELIGGTAPDVFYVDSAVAPNYIADGALLPLDEYVDQEDLDDIYPDILNIFQAEGVTYALPKDWSPLATYCNEGLLNEAGSSCSEVPTDLEDWPNYLEDTQVKMPEGTYVWGGSSIIERNVAWLEADGASFITDEGKLNLSNPEIIENAKFVSQFWSNPGFIDFADLGYESEDGPFVTGETALMISGAWNRGSIETDAPDMDWKVLKMPAYKGVSWSAGSSVGWGVNSQTKHVETAVQFVEYASNEGMKIMTEDQGAIPARYSIEEELQLDDDPVYAPFLEVKDNIIPLQFADFTSELSSEWNNTIPLVINGDLTIEEGFAQIDKTINDQMENFNE